MKIDLAEMIATDPTFPAGPLKGHTGSAVFAELMGIPDRLGGGTVVSVVVSLVTPDGLPVSGSAEKVGCEWHALFAPSNFTGYGTTRNGFKVTATVRREDGTTFQMTIGVGNLEISAGTPDSQPGDPSKNYVVKGDDVYCKSRVVDGVQHFVRQVMSYDPEIGWGADWVGDYVLEDGAYVEVG